MVWILTLAVAAGVARRLDLIFLLACAILAGYGFRRPRAPALVFALVTCGLGTHGWLASAHLAQDRAAFERASASAGPALVYLDGIVTGFPQTGLHGAAFEFRTALDGRPVRLQVRGEGFDAAYGDRYRLRARLLKSTPPGLRFLESRGLAGSVRVRHADTVLLGRGGNPVVRECFWPLHRWARTTLARALGGDAGLAIGMLLGERGQINDASRDAVRRLGITHLLAISGMHLTTVAGSVLLMMRVWPRRQSHALIIALTAYTATVGNVESLTRAYLMAMGLVAARATVRPLRAIDVLGKTLFVMAVAAPWSLRSVGLQLSFAATFAVLLCLPLHARPRAATGKRVSRWLRAALRPVGAAFVLSVAVELFIAPLQLHHFRAVSAVGPVATLAFFVPVTLILLGAVPVAVLAALMPAAEWPGAILASVSTWTSALIVACGRVAPAPLALPEPNPWLYYGGLVLGWRFRRRPLAWAGAALLVASAFRC